MLWQKRWPATSWTVWKGEQLVVWGKLLKFSVQHSLNSASGFCPPSTGKTLTEESSVDGHWSAWGLEHSLSEERLMEKQLFSL